jgi:hypothetical protein
MPITIQERAALMYRAFESKTRDSGAHFVCLRDDSPDWMTDVVRAAHNGMLPDDWTYATVMSACEFIADGGDLDDAHGWVDGQVDVYTCNLLRWAQSHAIEDIDEAMAETHYTSLSDALMGAQYRVIDALLASVIRALELVDDEEA